MLHGHEKSEVIEYKLVKALLLTSEHLILDIPFLNTVLLPKKKKNIEVFHHRNKTVTSILMSGACKQNITVNITRTSRVLKLIHTCVIGWHSGISGYLTVSADYVTKFSKFAVLCS